MLPFSQTLTLEKGLIFRITHRDNVPWILGIECSLLEIQKLAWFLEREIEVLALPNPLDLQFSANRYGPYANRLDHLLDGLDGSYLRSQVRIPDAKPTDVIAFNDPKKDVVAAYIKSQASGYIPALAGVSKRIDGFESPLGMELLATVDWLLAREGRTAKIADIKAGLQVWPGGAGAGERKLRLFDERILKLAIERLTRVGA